MLKPGEGYFVKASRECSLGGQLPLPPEEYVSVKVEKVTSNLLQFLATNNGNQPSYFVTMCQSPLSFERQVGNAWVALQLESPDTAHCLAYAVDSIEPGETKKVGAWNLQEYVAYEVPVEGGGFTNTGKMQEVGPGTYAVKFAFGSARDDAQQETARLEFTLPLAN